MTTCIAGGCTPTPCRAPFPLRWAIFHSQPCVLHAKFLPPSVLDLTYDLRLLHDNMLTGTVPPLSFPNLYAISLAQNKLTGSVPWSALVNSSIIQTVALNDNQLQGSLPPTLPPTLQYFVVQQNLFQGDTPSFAQTPSLKTLSIQGNALVGSLTLPTLQQWNASCTDISPVAWMQRFWENQKNNHAPLVTSCAEVQ